MPGRTENHRTLTAGEPDLRSSDDLLAAPSPANVDTVLFKNLVEIVPLVESLMDKRANSTFPRRASMVYTPAPWQMRKVGDTNGRKRTQSVSAKKRRDTGDNANLNSVTDDLSIFSSRTTSGSIQKNREELTTLQKQVDDLQKNLLEKDEAMKSVENSLKQMSAAHRSLDELKHQVTEKDSLIKSADSQLHSAKIKLADKQASLEKLEWEAKMSNKKLEELQRDVESMEFEAAALMHLFQELSKNGLDTYPDVKIDGFYHLEAIPHIDDVEKIELEKMEEARTDYLTAVAAAKEIPCEESISAAFEARRRLQAFVL